MANKQGRLEGGPRFGVPVQTAAFVHDVVNVVCIAVLDVLVVANYKLDPAVWTSIKLSDGPDMWAARWSGNYQQALLSMVFVYMLIDSLFIVLLPQSVKVPLAIFMHHAVCILAMTIPWLHPATHGYTLGIFMSADFNTLFLILRKLLMRSSKSGRALPRMLLPLVSAGFYTTWLFVRLLLYPAWLVHVSWPEWTAERERTGKILNLFAIFPLANGFAVLLNFKWTWDLCSNMLRQRGKRGGDDLATSTDGGPQESLIDPAEANASNISGSGRRRKP